MKVILKKKMHAADLPIENNLLKICKNVSILIARCFEFELFFYAHSGLHGVSLENTENMENMEKVKKISTG